HRQEDHGAVARPWEIAVGQVSQVGLVDSTDRDPSLFRVAQPVLAQRRLLVELWPVAGDLVVGDLGDLNVPGLGLQARERELGEQELLDVVHVEPDLVELLARLGARFASGLPVARWAEHVPRLALALADALPLPAVVDELPALGPLDRHANPLLGTRRDDVLLTDP